jgi:hypothetical protein
MMNAAAPDGAQSENPDGFFSSQSSLMRRLTPSGGSVTKKEKLKTFLPRRASSRPRFSKRKFLKNFLCFIHTG